MKYLCLVYMEASTMDSVSDAECLAFGETLEANGHRIAAEALQPIAMAKTVRVRNGRVTVTDGPFTE